MADKQNVPAKAAHYPKKTNLLLKRTSLLIDELEIRREEEKKFQLTPYEAGRYIQLKEVFKCQRPAEPIENALEDERALKEIRKEYLTASKIKRERQEIKENADLSRCFTYGDIYDGRSRCHRGRGCDVYSGVCQGSDKKEKSKKGVKRDFELPGFTFQ